MKIRGFFALLLTGLLAAVAACAGQPVAELYDKAEYRIAMRDSVALYTAVYTPKAPGKAPVIIFRTPYGCGPYGAGRFPQGFGKGYLRSYVDRGYIIVMQDVRGRYMSEGDFEHVRPAGSGETDETTDSYDTVDWLVRHIPHNNGRVGFAGCSYPGFYAMMGGLCGHPAVKAVSPQAPVTDWFMGDDVHHNGVLMLTDSYRFLSGMNTPPGRVPAAKMPSMSRQTQPDERTFFLEHTTLAELTALLKPNPFWEEMAAHPDYDAWWQERDLRRAIWSWARGRTGRGVTAAGRSGRSISAAMPRGNIIWSISRCRSSTTTSAKAIRTKRLRCRPLRSFPRGTTAGILSAALCRARRPKYPQVPMSPILPIPCLTTRLPACAVPKSIWSPTSVSCPGGPTC